MTIHVAQGDSHALQIERLEDRWLLAVVNWDGGGDGINWTDPLNWDTNALPGSDDDVVIDVAGTPTIRLASGTHQINSILSCATSDLKILLYVSADGGDFAPGMRLEPCPGRGPDQGRHSASYLCGPCGGRRSVRAPHHFAMNPVSGNRCKGSSPFSAIVVGGRGGSHHFAHSHLHIGLHDVGAQVVFWLTPFDAVAADCPASRPARARWRSRLSRSTTCSIKASAGDAAKDG